MIANSPMADPNEKINVKPAGQAFESVGWPGLAITPAVSEPRVGLGGRLSRLVRTLAGVNEEVLAWVPGDRARYTALGGVVLGTATIAAFSMLIVLTEILDGFHVALLLPVLIWGAFVLNLDRWLVTSSAGTRWHRSIAVLAPRFVLAFFFGVIIAEPLVLRIFESEIEQHILDERQVELQSLTSSLSRCNPDPTADDAAQQEALQAACAGLRLNLEATYAAISQELSSKQREAAVLRDGITADDAEQRRRDTLASNECAGTPGPGTTGKLGRGKECQEREREAEEFRRSHPIAERADKLADLNRQIETLLASLADAQRSYQGMRDRRIQEEVAKRASHHGAIGLLERLKTLHVLTSYNTALTVSTWMIRIFFILVDCLPVMVKFLGGKTRYDLLMDFRAESMRRTYEQGVKTNELDALATFKARQSEVENESRKRRAVSDLDWRWHEATLDAELSQRVDQLTDRLRGKRHQSDETVTANSGNGMTNAQGFGGTLVNAPPE